MSWCSTDPFGRATSSIARTPASQQHEPPYHRSVGAANLAPGLAHERQPPTTPTGIAGWGSTLQLGRYWVRKRVRSRPGSTELVPGAWTRIGFVPACRATVTPSAAAMTLGRKTPRTSTQSHQRMRYAIQFGPTLTSIPTAHATTRVRSGSARFRDNSRRVS
jgi:hypothetical protein